MRQLTRVVIAVLAAQVLILFLTTLYQTASLARDKERFPAPGTRIDANGITMHLHCTGQRIDDSPTIIFEGGIGTPSILWAGVQDGISEHTRTCTYDRAGYGWSDPSPSPRTAEQIVSELHTLLTSAGESPPYLLVGHSFGSAVVRLYADQHPDQVAALLLIDPRHEDFFERMPPQYLEIDRDNLKRARLLKVTTPLGITRIAGNFGIFTGFEAYLAPLPDDAESAAWARMIYNPQHWHTAVAEREASEQSYDQVRRSLLDPELPVIVLTAEHGADAWASSDSAVNPAAREIWMQMQQEHAWLTQRGCWIILEGSGHYPHMDSPEAIVDVLINILAQRPCPS